MRLRARLITLVGISCLSHEVAAQSVGGMLADDVAHFGSDVAAVWTAPFDASSRDWLLAAGAIGAFGVSMFADRPVAHWAANNRDSRIIRALKPMRRGGRAYSAKFLMPPLVGLYVAGLAANRQDLRDAATGCATSWFSQSMPRQVTYRLVARQRPDTSPDDPQRWDLPGNGNWHFQSFPAGHFANAVACATFWSGRYHLGVGAPVLYVIAAAVGAGRIADGGHWFSDTVLGGIIGYATGREVARRSLARVDPQSSGTGPNGSRSLSRPAPAVVFVIPF